MVTRPELLGEVKRIERRRLIEEGSESATFAVTWEGEPGAVLLDLESPDGELISFESLPPPASATDGRRRWSQCTDAEPA